MRVAHFNFAFCTHFHIARTLYIVESNIIQSYFGVSGKADILLDTTTFTHYYESVSLSAKKQQKYDTRVFHFTHTLTFFD